MAQQLEFDEVLRKGYLPEVLPPVFTTAPFADFVHSRGRSDAAGRRGRPGRTKPVEYNATKRANQRRTFAFPHPESFYDIASFLVQHWAEIERHFDLSTYSKSRPMPFPVDDRAISITSHKDLSVILYKEMSPFRYVVKSDISRFYPTVYTHSIPWSIHGKTASKNDTDVNSKKLPFNRLDVLLRQAQDGQSVGLPVGPDTSRIIAEIVGVAVDRAFALRHRDRDVKLIRHVDDIWIGASSMDEAEEFLYTYRECLREFGLDINELKTSVCESATAFEPSWPLSLKLLIRNEFRRLNVEDKTKALSEIFRLAYVEKDDGIIKYAIRRFDREGLWVESWNLLEDFLIRSMISFPHSIDYVARVAAWQFRRAHDVDVQKWNTVIVSSLNRNSNLGNDTEVCWLLWMMKELRIPVPANFVEAIIARCGAFPIVMFCHLNPRSIRQSKPRQQKLVSQMGEAPFRGSFWLLAYEAAVNNWIPDTELPRNQMTPFMQDMVAKRVSFFDSKANPRFMKYDDDGDPDYENYAIEDMAGRYDDDDDDDQNSWEL